MPWMDEYVPIWSSSVQALQGVPDNDDVNKQGLLGDFHHGWMEWNERWRKKESKAGTARKA